MYLCRREFIARPTLPALSLHALSKLALFTCRFHYTRNPYDVLYTLFPLPACAIHTPKMTITRSFITRALHYTPTLYGTSELHTFLGSELTFALPKWETV